MCCSAIDKAPSESLHALSPKPAKTQKQIMKQHSPDAKSKQYAQKKQQKAAIKKNGHIKK